MKKIALWIISLFLIFTYIYFRINPIINQAVPYTYDQGRDFLKTEEIIRYKNLTFIGPTTGIIGLYHGAWWYYLISIPYLVFDGWPMGFYWFIFLLSFLTNLIFFFFLIKNFNKLIALIFLSIISTSSYFISLSFSVSNNIIVPNLILLLIITSFYLLKTKKSIYLFLTSLILSFILEFEVSFGLFIIPIYFLVLILLSKDKKIFFKLKNIANTTFGLVIPLIPRLLFEIKNNFLQTKTLVIFFFQPKLHNPKPFEIVFNDRLTAFWHYFKSIFYNYNSQIAFGAFLIIILTILVFFYKNKNFILKLIKFNLLIILLLFSLSLFYKDNFWFNYFEGIQYIMLFTVLTSLFIISKNKKTYFVCCLILIFLISLSIFKLIRDLNSQNKKTSGFKEIDYSINYILKKENSKNFCLKIYTPPVIPYTYNYLISYYSRKNNLQIEEENFINNQCWYIIEDDSYQFRINDWKKNNIPKETSIKEKIRLENKTEIQLRVKKTI